MRSSGLIDSAARRLGFDPFELRRNNLVAPKPMPYRNAVGMTYDSGHYEENMDWAMRLADLQGFEQRRREAARRGKLLGRGLANYVEVLDRRAQRAGAHHGAAATERRSRHRHPAERAGP